MWNNIYFKSCKHWPLFFLSSDLLSPLPSQGASWELIMVCCPWSSGTLVLACREEIFYMLSGVFISYSQTVLKQQSGSLQKWFCLQLSSFVPC